MRKRLAYTAPLALAGAPAQAAVVHDFVTTSKSPSLEERLGPDGSLPLRITIADAVYLRGSVSLRREGCHGERPRECGKTGLWDQVSIEGISPLWGSGPVSLAFLSDGTLAGGIVEDGTDMNLTLAGSGFEGASSRFGSDSIRGAASAPPRKGNAPSPAISLHRPLPRPRPGAEGRGVAGHGRAGPGPRPAAHAGLTRRRPAPVIAPAGMPRPGRPPAPASAARRRCGRWGRG